MNTWRKVAAAIGSQRPSHPGPWQDMPVYDQFDGRLAQWEDLRDAVRITFQDLKSFDREEWDRITG